MTAKTTVATFVAQRAKLDTWGRNRDRAEEVKALAAKLDEEARDNWRSESWKTQVARDLEEFFDYGFENTTLFPSYIDYESVGELDRPVIRKRRGLKVFTVSRGGYIDESQLDEDVTEFPRSTMGFHVSEETDKLRLGFSRTIAEMADKGSMLFEAEVNRQVLALAQAATPIGSAYHTASVGLTKAELDAAVRGVREAIKPDGTGAIPTTILGRAGMVDAISDFAGNSYQPIFGDPALEEIRLKGYLGTYKGAGVVVVQNYQDQDGQEFLPGNQLWVLGGKAGKFVRYGAPQVSLWDERTVPYTHMQVKQDLGGLIYDAAQLHRIDDASVSGS